MSACPEQGWSLLCNGVILFSDDGEILPDGKIVAPPRQRSVTESVHQPVA